MAELGEAKMTPTEGPFPHAEPGSAGVESESAAPAGKATAETDAQTPEAALAELMEGADAALQWFAVHTYSSFETKVKQAIEHRAALEGAGDVINRVIIPMEMVVEIKGGKKRTTARTLMPGYILVQMMPGERAFNFVKSIKGVSGFVGGSGSEPVPLSPEEVANLVSMMESKREKPKPKILYRKGDNVKVIEGPFMNFVGSVEEVDEEKGRLKVMVSIFGRPTPVELDVLQVEGT